MSPSRFSEEKVMQRSRILLSFLAFGLLGFLPMAAHASKPDPADYPLRIRIYSTHWGRQWPVGWPDFDVYPGEYVGYGRANLSDAAKINAIDYTFYCDAHFMTSEDSEAYPARWKKNKEGRQLEMLVGIIGTDHVVRCSLSVAIKPFVYGRLNGKRVTWTQEEYAARAARRAESEAELQVSDPDPQHYPLKLSVLHLDMGGREAHLYTGSGLGNILEPDGAIHAADFALNCPVRIQETVDGRYYSAKWDAGKTHLTILLRKIGDATQTATCSAQTSLHGDVYVRTASGVQAVSQQKYREMKKDEVAAVGQ
jgi:hypothetical protein